MRPYLQQIDQAAQRRHGSTDLMDMFKSTFVAMNGANGAQELSGQSYALGTVNLRADAGIWSDADTSWLTGSADFGATLNAMRLGHQSLFPSKPPGLSHETTPPNDTSHQMVNSTSQVPLASDKDTLFSTTRTRSSSQFQRVQKYEFAKLIEDRVTPPELLDKQTDMHPMRQQFDEQQAARKVTGEEKQPLFTTWHAMVFMV